MSKNRELIILPKVNQAQLSKFLPELENEGIKTIYLDPKKLGKKKTKLQTVSTSNSSNYVVLEKEGATKPKGKKLESNLKYYQIQILKMFYQFQKKD